MPSYKFNSVPVPPEDRADVILDTDAFNEIDDQFAIAYLLHSQERFDIKAFNAAPFFNGNSVSPEDGMIKSFNEIIKLLELDGSFDKKSIVYEGSRTYLPDEKTPVESPAARVIVEHAKKHTPDNPLYVLAIGAITNMASALLMDECVEKNTVVVWLGGHAYETGSADEFNMVQDIAAARVVFGCRVPVVMLPCRNVVDRCFTTEYELRHWLEGKNPLADYLCKNTVDACFGNKNYPQSKVIWDITAVAWLHNKDGRHMECRPERALMPEYDGHYSSAPDGKFISYACRMKRDAIFNDLFGRIT